MDRPVRPGEIHHRGRPEEFPRGTGAAGQRPGGGQRSSGYAGAAEPSGGGFGGGGGGSYTRTERPAASAPRGVSGGAARGGAGGPSWMPKGGDLDDEIPF